MKFKKYYIAIVLLGLVVSLSIGYRRYVVEQSNRIYEITMAFEEVEKSAAFRSVSLQEELAKWRDAGVNSITLNEMTIKSLEKMGKYNLHTHFEGNNLVVEGEAEGLKMIAERLKERLVAGRQIGFRDSQTLLISGDVNDFFNTAIQAKYDLFSERTSVPMRLASVLEFVGLGYSDREIELVEASALAMRFRPAYIYGVQDAKRSIDDTFSYIDRHSKQPYICFVGNDVLGTDFESDYLAEQLRARNMSVGMIETTIQRGHVEQDGLLPLVEKLDYRAVRLFSTFNFIRDRYDYHMPGHHSGEEVANTFFRAISERNISVIYFRTYTRAGKLIDVPTEVYKKNFDSLRQRLAAHGVTNISADWDTAERNFYMDVFHADHRLVGVVALAVVAASLLLINLFYALPRVLNLTLMVITMPTTYLLFFLNIKPSLCNAVFGLAAVIVFATLSIYYIIWQGRKILDADKQLTYFQTVIKGIAVLAAAVLIALAGSFIEISFYADSKYLLEMAIFRGVKISQLLPLLIALFIAVYYFGGEILQKKGLKRTEQIKYVLSLNVKIWQVLLGFVLLALVAILLLRSGHDKNIQTLSLELLFRNVLEFVLYARPRTKALMLGFPIVIFFIQIVNARKYAWSYPIFAFLIGIGQADLLNTFSHIRTPLELSLVRVFLAFALSIVVFIGYAAGVAILRIVVRWVIGHIKKQSAENA